MGKADLSSASQKAGFCRRVCSAAVPSRAVQTLQRKGCTGISLFRQGPVSKSLCQRHHRAIAARANASTVVMSSNGSSPCPEEFVETALRLADAAAEITSQYFRSDVRQSPPCPAIHHSAWPIWPLKPLCASRTEIPRMQVPEDSI